MLPILSLSSSSLSLSILLGSHLVPGAVRAAVSGTSRNKQPSGNAAFQSRIKPLLSKYCYDSKTNPLGYKSITGLENIDKVIEIDQSPIGRTPRSNLATYTGLFDHVRRLFAATKAARSRHYDAGRFSFNVAKGRCENCEGEGFVMVELLFLPSVYAPCPVCQGARYNAKTATTSSRSRIDRRDQSVDLIRNDDPLPAPDAMLALGSPEPPTYQRAALVIPKGIPDALLRSDGYANARH